jgi:hypothetical protein
MTSQSWNSSTNWYLGVRGEGGGGEKKEGEEGGARGEKGKMRGKREC